MTKYLDRIANWYFNRNTLPFWGILLIDNAIVFASYLFVFLLFNRSVRTMHTMELLSLSIVIFLVFYNIGFRIFRTYSGILRYSTFVDLQRVGYAMIFGSSIAFIIHKLLMDHSEMFTLITGSQIVAAFAVATFLMWILRIMVKTFYDVAFASRRAKRTYIYGVKNDGIAIAKHIRTEKPMRFQLKGFVTIEKDMEGHILMGSKVRMVDEHIVETMKANKIEALIVSPYRLRDFRNNQHFQDELIKAGINIYIEQREKEMTGTEQALGSEPQLKEISIEDLLPRDEIQVDMDSVGKQLTWLSRQHRQ